jgi:hypothetical protein
MKQHLSHAPGFRVGPMMVACGLAVGTASVVAVANALYDMAR